MTKKYPKGVTLIESLFATTILVVALCFLLEFYVNCLFLNDTNRNLSLAVSHAEYVMEEIKNSDFTGLESMIISGSWDWNEEDILSKNLAFRSGDPLGISVRVSWNDRDSRARYKELQTLITDS